MTSTGAPHVRRRRWPTGLLGVLVLLVLALVSAPAAPAAPPADFQSSLVIGDGLNGPSGFEIAPDGGSSSSSAAAGSRS
jgi:hypothetical protein